MTLEDLYNLIVGIKPQEEPKAREPTKIDYSYNNLLDKGLDKGKENEQCRTL